jgi:broad specificity phosphatase PhoE
MTTLYLVRHGQKQPYPGDPGLTELGLIQAQETGLYLQKFPITHIVSSPLKRAVETAAQIAQVLKMPYTTNPALVERMNWTGEDQTMPEFLQEWVKATLQREYVPLHGQSSRETGEKVANLAEGLSHPDAHLVFVSHGGAIADYLRNLFGDEDLAVLRHQYSQGQDYQLFNAAISKVVLAESPTLEFLNFTEHLTQTTE